MRTRRKRRNNIKKITQCLCAMVILTGIGSVVYKGEIWETWSLSAEQNTKGMAEAANKSDFLLSRVIRNVTNENLVPQKMNEQTSIVEVTGTVKLNTQQQAFFEKLNNWELKQQKQFVYSEWFAAVESKLSEQPTEATYSYLASLLYEAAVKSGFQVGERHLHQQLPEYASTGFDVFVRPGRNDMSIYNPKESSARVSISYTDDYPHIRLSAQAEAGWKAAPSSIKHTQYAPEKVDVLDRSLVPGSQLVHSPGKAGQLIEVTVGEQLLSKDFYLPSPAIVWHGPVPEPAHPEDITLIFD
jgi:hypothetical protein